MGISKKTYEEVEREVDLYMFTTLINMDSGGGLTDEDMCRALKKEFDVEITPEELRLHYEPTVEEMELDYRLIYQNCVK